MVKCPYCGLSVPAAYKARNLVCSGCRRASVIQGRKAKRGKS